jgi:hypothetical protein
MSEYQPFNKDQQQVSPDVACPKNPVICQIATRFANSVFVYQHPSRKMMIGEKADSKKPIMKRKAYICWELVAPAWAKLHRISSWIIA